MAATFIACSNFHLEKDQPTELRNNHIYIKHVTCISCVSINKRNIIVLTFHMKWNWKFFSCTLDKIMKESSANQLVFFSYDDSLKSNTWRKKETWSSFKWHATLVECCRAKPTENCKHFSPMGNSGQLVVRRVNCISQKLLFISSLSPLSTKYFVPSLHCFFSFNLAWQIQFSLKYRVLHFSTATVTDFSFRSLSCHSQWFVAKTLQEAIYLYCWKWEKWNFSLKYFDVQNISNWKFRGAKNWKQSFYPLGVFYYLLDNK